MTDPNTIIREAESVFADLANVRKYGGKESTRGVLRAIIATCKLAHADYPAAVSSIRRLAEAALKNIG